MSALNELQRAIKQLRELQGDHSLFTNKLDELNRSAQQMRAWIEPAAEIAALVRQAQLPPEIQRALSTQEETSRSIKRSIDERKTAVEAMLRPTLKFDTSAFDKAVESMGQLLNGTSDQRTGKILELLSAQAAIAKNLSPEPQYFARLQATLGKLPVISAQAAQTLGAVTSNATATVVASPPQQASNEQLAGLVMYVVAQLTKKKTFTRFEFQTVILYPLVFLMVSPFWNKLVEGWLAKPQAAPVIEIQLDERRATRPLVIRMNARMKSPKIGELGGGVVVEVVQSQKEWTMVESRDAKGNRIIGWVLTRYLERAPKRR